MSAPASFGDALTGKPINKKADAAAAPVKVAAAPSAAAAPSSEPSVEQVPYNATNGKWTIGGLTKHDVYKLVVRNGMAA